MSKIDKAIDAAINDIADCAIMAAGENWSDLRDRLYEYFSDIKPEPVEVNEYEASVVERAKQASYPANWISEHAHQDPGGNNTKFDEDRLMRAYVNGYTVRKPK